MMGREKNGKKILLSVAIGLFLIGAGGVSAGLAAEQKPFYFLGLHCLSGNFAGPGEDGNRGCIIALEERNYKVSGRTIEYLVRDTELKPEATTRKAREAIEKYGVQYMMAGLGSHIGLAAIEVARDKKIVLMNHSSGSSEITGEKCSRFGFRWTNDNSSIAKTALIPFLKERKDLKTVYCLVQDYAWGQDMYRNSKPILEQQGLKILGTDFIPVGTTDFSSYLLKAKGAKPDFLYTMIYGGDQIIAAKQVYEFGMRKYSKAILFPWSGTTMIHEIGPEACEGVFFGLQWWYTYDNEFSKKFTKRFLEKHKVYPDNEAIGAYYSLKVVLDTIERLKTDDVKKFIVELEKETPMDGPTGKEYFRKWDHQNQKQFFIYKGKNPKDYKFKEDYMELVTGGSLYRTREENPCRFKDWDI
jgi:branched-chain amino acid transport system substrate-binding protein